jgi:hypothetical protein
MVFKLEHQGANQIRIASFTNMAGDAGAGSTGVRRPFWRKPADVWRMVNERLKAAIFVDP